MYGTNTSGKSNLIEAFEFLQRFWFNKPKNKDKSIGIILFLLDKHTSKGPSAFSLFFYIDVVKYMYSLEKRKVSAGFMPGR